MTPHAGRQALDCSRPGTALFWGLLGALLGLTACLVQGAPNWASMLRVGLDNPLRERIVGELGPITSASRTGHDGQLYYSIARDPFATGPTVEALLTFDIPRYRYRRILVPLVAGGFGRFSPKVTLFSIVFWTIFGMSLMTIGIADLAYKFDLPGGSVFLAVANLGAIVSVMLLTPDVIALGLSLVGVSLVVRRRIRWALAVLAMAALTKETYLLVPLALAAWHWRQHDRRLAIALAAVPTLPLAIWSVWLWFVIPEIPQDAAVLGLPMQAMILKLGNWMQPGTLDAVQMAFAIYSIGSFGLAAGLLFTRRIPVLRWVMAPWLILAAFAGAAVWAIPTNVGRAFSILWPLAVLLLFDRGGWKSLTRPSEDGQPPSVRFQTAASGPRHTRRGTTSGAPSSRRPTESTERLAVRP